MTCTEDSNCWFMFSCVEGVCLHQNLLPITTYNAFVYILIPFLVALANLAGISSGFLKFILFMDFLNYSEVEATILAYPIIFGGGLANFFILVRQKHPFQKGPSINYSVANIILPCVVIGTTFGSLTNSLIPQFILDLLSIIICIVLGILFYFQLRDYLSQRKIESGEYKKLLPERLKRSKKTPKKTLQLVQIQEQYGEQSEAYEKNSSSNSDMSPQKKRQIRTEVIQEQSLNVPIWEIVFSLFFFSLIEVTSLLLQGRLVPFSICQGLGGLALPLLILLLIIIQFGYYYFHIKPKHTKIEQFKVHSDIDLSIGKNVLIICVGTFIGGFSTGLVAVGCGHIMILTLTHLNMNQKIASATSGYQIVFIGMASTLQAILFGYLGWQDFLFLATLAFIGSFFLTIAGQYLFAKMSDQGIGLIISILIGIIGISIIGILISMSFALSRYGLDKMMIPSGLEC